MTKVIGPNGFAIDVTPVTAEGLLKDKASYRLAEGETSPGDARIDGRPADAPPLTTTLASELVSTPTAPQKPAGNASPRRPGPSTARGSGSTSTGSPATRSVPPSTSTRPPPTARSSP